MPNVKATDRRKPQENFYCVVCASVIPPERVIRKAVTCNAVHAKILKLERRRLRDLTRCRACNRPSTPEERADFVAWRKDRGSRPGPKPKVKDPAAPPAAEASPASSRTRRTAKNRPQNPEESASNST